MAKVHHTATLTYGATGVEPASAPPKGFAADEHHLAEQVREALNDTQDSEVNRIAEATTLPADVSKALAHGLEANLAEQCGPVEIVERYAGIYDQSLDVLRAKRGDIRQAMEDRQTSHDDFMAYKSEELRQIELAITAAESARRVLNGEPSDEEIARATERAREIVRQRPANKRTTGLKKPRDVGVLKGEQLPDGNQS